MNNLKEEFDKNFELDKEINKTYVEVMEVVKKTHKPTLQKFIDETGLGKGTFYNLTNGYKKPLMTSLVAFAVVFKINLKNVEDLLRAWGLGFEPGNKVHHAYSQLIEKFSGKTMAECNEFLKEVGIHEKYWLNDGRETR